MFTFQIKAQTSSSLIHYNCIINSENNSITIPTRQLATGQYVVNLVANGNIIDAKYLIIN